MKQDDLFEGQVVYWAANEFDGKSLVEASVYMIEHDHFLIKATKRYVGGKWYPINDKEVYWCDYDPDEDDTCKVFKTLEEAMAFIQ